MWTCNALSKYVPDKIFAGNKKFDSSAKIPSLPIS